MPELEFEIVGIGPDLVEYTHAWDVQRAVHSDVADGRRKSTVLLLEHQPVYTAGKRTELWERPFDGTEVIDVDRGGKITWHGPGQLVGYPIIDLGTPLDVVAYVRRLEEAMIGVCAHFGVCATRVEGRTGVWVRADDRGRDRKIAAIGIRVARGVAMHGFAINCDPDLAAFSRIVPCGIDDADVTSLSQETGRDISVAQALPVAVDRLRQVLSGPIHRSMPIPNLSTENPELLAELADDQSADLSADLVATESSAAAGHDVMEGTR